MTDRQHDDKQAADSPAREGGTPGNGGPSTNRGQVPDGLEGSIMEPASERKKSDNAGDRAAGNERRSDEL